MDNQITLRKGRIADANSILYCKADSNYTSIHFVDGSKYLSANTLATFQKKLEAYPFFRTNRSTLINLNFLELKNYLLLNETVFLKSNLEINISRSRKADFQKIISAKKASAIL